MAIINKITKEGFSFTHSRDKSPKNSDFPSHIHDTYEILCLVRGNVDYMVEGRLYKLTPGAIMIMRPSETHRLIVNKSTEYERYVINFSGSILSSSLLSSSILAPFKNRPLGEGNMYLASEMGAVSPILLLQKMEEECRLFNENDSFYANLYSLLSALNLSFGTREKTEENGGGNEIITYVNENLTNELSIEKIARETHVSPSQVWRVFKELTGKSPHSYIIAKRLILFNKMVKNGMGAIKACQACGFRDYSSFYRLYKKNFGKSPGE